MYVQPIDRPIFYVLLGIPIGALLIAGAIVIDGSLPAYPDEELSTGHWWLILYTAALAGFTLLLFIAAALQVALFFWQLRLIARNISDAKTAAEAAKDNAAAALQLVESTTRAERAYVKMTYTPPGLNFFVDGTITLEVQTANFGRTPARIEGIYCRFHVLGAGEQLSADPDYSRERGVFQRSHMILAGGGEDRTFQRFDFPVGVDVSSLIRSGARRVFVFGYIDYSDAFNGAHRAGYGRHYDPAGDDRRGFPTPEAWDARRNLGLLTEREYNYDRQRRGEPGEPHA